MNNNENIIFGNDPTYQRETMTGLMGILSKISIMYPIRETELWLSGVYKYTYDTPNKSSKLFADLMSSVYRLRIEHSDFIVPMKKDAERRPIGFVTTDPATTSDNKDEDDSEDESNEDPECIDDGRRRKRKPSQSVGHAHATTDASIKKITKTINMLSIFANYLLTESNSSTIPKNDIKQVIENIIFIFTIIRADGCKTDPLSDYTRLRRAIPAELTGDVPYAIGGVKYMVYRLSEYAQKSKEIIKVNMIKEHEKIQLITIETGLSILEMLNSDIDNIPLMSCYLKAVSIYLSTMTRGDLSERFQNMIALITPYM